MNIDFNIRGILGAPWMWPIAIYIVGQAFIEVQVEKLRRRRRENVGPRRFDAGRV